MPLFQRDIAFKNLIIIELRKINFTLQKYSGYNILMYANACKYKVAMNTNIPYTFNQLVI